MMNGARRVNERLWGGEGGQSGSNEIEKSSYQDYCPRCVINEYKEGNK